MDIQIIDYGFGNLHSVRKAMEFLGVSVSVIDSPASLTHADGVILPGVGAFGDGMLGLEQRGFTAPLVEYANSGKPLLGICLGMQFLFTCSEEFGTHRGLDIIKGKVMYLPKRLVDDGFKYRIPQIGWNGLLKPPGTGSWQSTLLEGVNEGDEVYFVHSFHGVPEDPNAVLAYTRYGGNLIVAAVRRGNIYGFQFHPEKSRDAGLKMLRNFAGIVAASKAQCAV